MRRVATLLVAVRRACRRCWSSAWAPARAAATSYEVRAIFDNASYIVKGEDVKVAGAVIGEIKSLDVTDDKRAAITLKINEARLHAVPRRTRAARSARSR